MGENGTFSNDTMPAGNGYSGPAPAFHLGSLCRVGANSLEKPSESGMLCYLNLTQRQGDLHALREYQSRRIKVDRSLSFLQSSQT